jgi:pyruvate/2-oxoglutarate/acetoin dehydrogenase E1 component/TPP-dependent pyruvate/acetoin dehydrogenase alpha subunit
MPKTLTTPVQTETISAQQAIEDYRIGCLSRECSLLGRKEVLTGKAKFGIFGDGKEVAQLAMARAFQRGDFRSGYYRDQTFMMALGLCSAEDFFAQLYADPVNDPFSAGRQMNAHFATRLVDEQGQWLEHTALYNVSADISPTAGQMARSLGLAAASKTYRSHPGLQDRRGLSAGGNEVSFVTIGDASTSEGVFWESVNAAAVTRVPLAVFVWDDGYGISVPKKYQTAKESISQSLSGMATDREDDGGIYLYRAKGWDYAELCRVFAEGVEKTRRTQVPVLFHVEEITQPQGHSTSGSHERYKSPERLTFEREWDGLHKMAEWLIAGGMATAEQLQAIQEEAKQTARNAAKTALERFNAPIREEGRGIVALLERAAESGARANEIRRELELLSGTVDPLRRDHLRALRQSIRVMRAERHPLLAEANALLERSIAVGTDRYLTNLYSGRALEVPVVAPEFGPESPVLNGFQILNACFDHALERLPEVVAFGEDVGNIGDVNQGFMNLQQKYGVHRVFDTGIREWTIMGQGIGMAMRGLRPIAEIQYLDYLLYGLEPLSDDLATLRYRCNGQQMAPLIVRTRGHRLEGIWHTGSPIGMILHALRGMYVCVPRNMTQAAGMYNTLLRADEPALVIECLNGYRLKERQPDNIGSFTVPLGVPEILHAGTDVTLVTYGSCVRIAQEALEALRAEGISVELIDAQTLLPFDRGHLIAESLRRTNRLVVLDEDVPGGASAFILQQILEVQGGYRWLDAAPVTIAAAENRAPFGSEGDYFTKPSAEDVFERIYALMHEGNPARFPL